MYKEIFHIRLKEARKETGYSQRQVEAYTGITHSNIAKYETGKLEPNLESLGTLAQFYNKSLNWLLGVAIEPEIRPEKERTERTA